MDLTDISPKAARHTGAEDAAARPDLVRPAAARPAPARPAAARPDPDFLLKSALPDDVSRVLTVLGDAGYSACLVGGAVRDILRGAEPVDFDLASAAKPEELAAVFTEATDWRLVDTGGLFGSMTLLTEHRSIEITTFRSDGSYSDSRHPDTVRFSSSVQDDLSRRDFTVNAMAFSLAEGLIDPFGGRADLAAKTLRAVGDADARLREDALRIMRALRFAATLGLTVDEALRRALHENRQLLRSVSAERIQAELVRLIVAESDSLLPVLLEFGDCLAVPIPELAAALQLDQLSPWHAYDVWEHSARAMTAVNGDDMIVRLALLLHDIGKPPTFKTDENGRGHFYGHAPLGAEMARPRLQALRFDSQTIEQTCDLIRNHFATLTPDIVLRWLRRLGEQQLRRLIMVKRGDLSAHVASAAEVGLQNLDKFEAALDEAIASAAAFSLSQLAVNGDDLLGIGYVAGPALGQALETLLDAVVDGQLSNRRDDLLAAAAQILRDSTG